jgi:serine protease AprX
MQSPYFRPGYPVYPHVAHGLLTTPHRMNALPDYTGRGVVMAFIDAGFYDHPDILSRIVTHVDCTTDQFSTQATAVPTCERFVWHGQMTSVIGAGNGSINSGKYHGIACESDLVLITVSSPDEQVKEADILRGFQWLLKNHKHFNIRVVNVSVGGDFVNSHADYPLHQAVHQLVAAGVVVVIAAGNHGERHLLPPASAPEAIVVGGYNDMNTLDPHEWRGYHSNFGVAHDLSHKPDVIAPAQWVASPILPTSQVAKEAQWLGKLLNGNSEPALTDLFEHGLSDLHIAPDEAHRGERFFHRLEHRIHELKLVDEHYQYVDGTSVAAPIISSIVAQMLEANRKLTPKQISGMLKTASHRIHHLPPERQGAGIPDAAKAVQLAQALRKG